MNGEEKKGKVVQVQYGGRISIPKDLREEMDIRDGDFVSLSLRKTKVIEIEEAANVKSVLKTAVLAGEEE